MTKTIQVITFAFVAVCLALMLALGYQIESRVYSETETNLRENLKNLEFILEEEFQSMRSDLRFLAATPPIQGIARATNNSGIDPFDGTSLDGWKERLQVIFKGFIENNPKIAQIRYIGAQDNNRELVRVERIHGAVNLVANKNLQQKSGEFYVQKALESNPGEIKISDITLNREYGQIEFPFWPTYRLTMPVFDVDNRLFGLVVINMRAQPLLDALISAADQGYDLYIINSTGEFVVHPAKEYQYGVELETGHDINGNFTFLSNEGSLGLNKFYSKLSKNKYYYLNHKFPLAREFNSNYLSLYLAVSEKHLYALIGERRNSTIIAIIGILLLGVMTLFVVSSHIQKTMSLSETRAQYEAIVSSSSEAIVSLDGKGAVTSWNLAAVDMFGISETVALHKPVWHLIKSESQVNFDKKVVEEVLEEKRSKNFELRALDHSGEVIHISVTVSPIKSNEETKGVVASIRDITAQKEAEEKIVNLNQDLEEQVRVRTRELEIAHSKALSASNAKSAFVANVSHEIRTPLNGILGMLKLLEQDEGPNRKRYLTMAQNSTQTLMGLINQVLDLSKIEAGKLQIESLPFNLAKLIDQLVASMSLAGQTKGLEMVLDLNDLERTRVSGDAIRIKQILANLIGNAIKFTESGQIVIKAALTTEAESRAVLRCSVQDSGIGIAPEKVDQIFSEFSQEEQSTSRQYGGSGLGLSICKHLCEAMNGEIWVESNKGQGSCFTFQIPLELDPIQTNSLKHDKLKDHTVLIVEEHPDSRSATSKLFAGWGAEVIDFPSTVRANQFLASTGMQKVALLVFGQGVSEIDCLEIIKSLAINHLNNLPPVVFTLPQISQRNLAAFDEICSTYIVNKPISPFEMWARVQVALALESSDRDKASAGVNSNQVTARKRDDIYILAADDSEVNQQVLLGLLGAEDYKVKVAADGLDVIKMLQDERVGSKIALILMDCNMPGVDGYEATQRIRQGEAGARFCEIPIIAVTANALAGVREKCLEAGMNDYLSKPIETDKLFDKVDYWLERAPIPHADPVDHGSAARAQFNWENALLKYDGDQSLLSTLLQVFLDTVPQQVEEMKTALEQQEFHLVNNLAHTIKGAAGAIDADQLQALADEIFQLTLDGCPPDAQVNHTWDLFYNSFQELLKELRSIPLTELSPSKV